MKTITIKEEVQLPGTNIILEKGDRIVLEASKAKLTERAIDLDKEYNAITSKTSDPEDAGTKFGSSLAEKTKENYDIEDEIMFYEGLVEYIRKTFYI